MIDYVKYELDNGLKLIVHKDNSTPFVAMNLLYDVGSKDESPNKTGLAHLFEHIMFGGSVNVPVFDEPIEMAGGMNNAFTNTDITNYYIVIPKDNIEIAFWVESDRMLGLIFSEDRLDVQRKVVVEEFKQSYLNQPYGDVYLLIRDLSYKVHPYRWATIGKDISHIEKARLSDVEAFFRRHYSPSNAILCIAGDVEPEEILSLTKKWFGSIPRGEKYIRNLPQEPVQKRIRRKVVYRDVPLNAIYMVFHSVERSHRDYYTTDLLSDILSNGYSSRLYQRLVKELKVFSEINAFITGEIERGLFIVSGKVIDGIDVKEAEELIFKELNNIKVEKLSDEELTKVKNKIESLITFENTSVLNKAMELCMAEHLGNINMVNEIIDFYLKISVDDIKRVANDIFKKSNCSILYYLKSK